MPQRNARRRSQSGDAHPPLRWMADSVDGTLSPVRAAKLATHLASGCAPCAARLAGLRGTLAALKSGPLAAPPRTVRSAARRLNSRARFDAIVERVRGIVAHLVSDGRAAPAFAMRAAPGDERRMFWTAGRWDVDACLISGTNGADMLGQVVPADDSATGDADDAFVSTMTAHSGRRTRRAQLSSDGRFTFRGLSAGLWTIDARIGDATISIPPFVVESGS